MKSVCIVVQNYYEQDNRVRRKAEALVAAGYSVDVLSLRSTYSPSRSYNLNGVSVHTLPLAKKRGSLARYMFEYLTFFLWASFKLSILMGKRHYAVVDVNNLPDFLVFAAAYAKWKGAKVVFDMHEITPEFYMSKFKIEPASRLVQMLKFVEKASFDFADHVITINNPIQDLLASRGLPHEKSTLIMNSADESLFAAEASRAASADDTAREPKFVMMYHGTLTRLYGLDIALEALAMAQPEMPGAELWILGGGSETNSLKELSQRLGLSSKVRFLGTVLPQEIPQWLSRSDIGVLPTRQDVFLDFSFSNKLSEYVIMEKPVICSRLKTIRHYFSEESLAFFEPNNPADLARQMVHLYADSELRDGLAMHAKLEYRTMNWAVMRARYLGMMGELCGVKQPSKRGVTPPSAELVFREGAN